MKAKITAAQRRRMAAGIRLEIRRYQRCVRLLDRVDVAVLAAGMDLFEDEGAVALWLCEPARALGGEVPLRVIRTAKGRNDVAGLLTAIAHGVVL